MPSDQTQTTTSNIVALPGIAHSNPPGEPYEEVVTLLREWLASAERGELAHVLIAGVKPVRGIRTEWAGNASADDCLAAVTGLQMRVAASWVSTFE